MKSIAEELDDLHDKIYKGYHAVEKINKALDLGYRVNVFQPAHDAFKQVNRIIAYVSLLEKDNKRLIQEIELLKSQSNLTKFFVEF